MLTLTRRCMVADPDGTLREFRVLAGLPDGVLLLLSARDGETFRFLSAGGQAVDILAFLRGHAVALDPRSGQFLTENERAERLAGAPVLRLLLSA